MRVRELIDFYLAVRTPGQLLGFDALFSQDLDALKSAVREHYGSQEAWLALPEDAELPGEIAGMAQDLMERYQAWNKTEDETE